jgi:glycine/D-amino acid oxidase-like deaminating enzyme/nitrite reductase/ring-hydroxylating ferredoxin subunit
MTDTTTARGSYWLQTTPAGPAHPRLTPGERADVAVIGGGLVGVTTALLLARAGVDVVLLEAATLGSGVSGATTSKVTSLHGMAYAELAAQLGPERARMYGEANERALAWMRDLVAGEDLRCDWRERTAWTYTVDPGRGDEIAREAHAAAEAGVPATLAPIAPLPFQTAAAVHVEHQAECHARRYVLAVAQLAERAGARIFEDTRVRGVDDGTPCTVQTEHGDLLADRVVVATHYPILDRGVYFARLEAQRSYCVAARADGEVPEGMFYGVDGSGRSLRTAPLDDGGTLVIAGGEGHKVGENGDAGRHYRVLWEWLREHIAVEPRTAYRWSSQDSRAPDGLPYAGPLHPRTERLYVITALRKWGFTNGTAGAHVVAAHLTAGEDPAAALLDPNRVNLRASLKPLIVQNAEVAKHFIGDRLASPDADGPAALAPGDAALLRCGGRKVAAYRDGDGQLHAVSATCTHLGCELRFNAAETSWDCPCHGSRFGVDGEVLEGPAVDPLERRALDVSEDAAPPPAGR